MLIPFVKMAQSGVVLVAMNTACPPMPEPKITVAPLEIPMRQDFNRTSAEIRQIAGNVYTPFTGTDNALAGLMTGSVRANVNVEFDGGPIETPPGAEPLACIWPNVINVDITLEPTLYVNKNYPVGTCMHNVIAQHELGHYQIDKSVIFDFIPLIQQAVNGAAKRIGVQGPLPFDKTRALGEPVGEDIRNVVRAMVVQIDAERRKRNAAHDSPTEQLRLLQACQQATTNAPNNDPVKDLYFTAPSGMSGQ